MNRCSKGAASPSCRQTGGVPSWSSVPPTWRWVPASAAAPLVLSPVTLWNHAGSCGAPASFLEEPAATGDIAPRQQQRRRELASYLDAGQRPFLHLLDGGLSDNIALGAFTEAAEIHGSVDAAIAALDFRGVRKLVFIIVNAETESDRGPDLSTDVPGISQVGRALGDIPINRYSYETQLRLRQSLQRWHRAPSRDRRNRGLSSISSMSGSTRWRMPKKDAH